MNTKELLAFHAMTTGTALALMAKKNHDYAGSSGDTPFANFEVVEKLNIASTEKGILMRMLDKMMRLSTFAEAGQLKVENESAQDACIDIINYSVLLAAYIKQKDERRS